MTATVANPPDLTRHTMGTVSIVLCTRNRADGLNLALKSIVACELPSQLVVELVVVDNGSTDHTRAVVEELRCPNMEVRYVYEPRTGLSRARNRGLQEARGTALLFTDDDVRVPQDWIGGMSAPILDGQADAVQGGVHLATGLERPWMKGMLRTWVAAAESSTEAPEGLVGANMAVSRRAAEIVGGFDPALGAGALGFYEDTLFGWQVEANGLRKLYRPRISVEHHFDSTRLTNRTMLGTAVKMAKSRAYVMHHWMHEGPATLVEQDWKSIAVLFLWWPIFTAKWMLFRAIDERYIYHYFRRALKHELTLLEGSPRNYSLRSLESARLL